MIPSRTHNRSRAVLPLASLALLSGATLVIAPFLGMEVIAPAKVLSDAFTSHVFLSLRLPRVLTGFVAGSGLALCGMVFQAMLRNPMATPFTLGIASGASFGAAVTILLDVTGSILGIPFTSLGAFLGAAVSMSLVFGFSSLRRTASSLTMLLAGIAVSFMFSSLLMFVQYLSNIRHSFQIVRWLMGGLEVFGFDSFWTMAPFVGVGIVLIAAKLPELNHLLAGEDLARSRGVNVRQTRTILFAATSLTVGAIVAVCGPIGFIGMMAPHICRILFGADHRILGIATFLFGGAFLVVADTAARTVIAPAEIPVGVITALLGGPFFLWILFRNRKSRGDDSW